ncbi:hypothetical protein ADEAN_000587100 [Angomonas deanei]|uniref:Uncharacterized protein n=1 Tax=Angomonas deanei TaxID=59799 RepID=A0A7G2CI65_9TRYP|nr:hypothetical protein ADEAN_000587100 [Angomonas deanei]
MSFLSSSSSSFASERGSPPRGIVLPTRGQTASPPSSAGRSLGRQPSPAEVEYANLAGPEEGSSTNTSKAATPLTSRLSFAEDTASENSAPPAEAPAPSPVSSPRAQWRRNRLDEINENYRRQANEAVPAPAAVIEEEESMYEKMKRLSRSMDPSNEAAGDPIVLVETVSETLVSPPRPDIARSPLPDKPADKPSPDRPPASRSLFLDSPPPQEAKREEEKPEPSIPIELPSGRDTRTRPPHRSADTVGDVRWVTRSTTTDPIAYNLKAPPEIVPLPGRKSFSFMTHHKEPHSTVLTSTRRASPVRFHATQNHTYHQTPVRKWGTSGNTRQEDQPSQRGTLLDSVLQMAAASSLNSISALPVEQDDTISQVSLLTSSAVVEVEGLPRRTKVYKALCSPRTTQTSLLEVRERHFHRTRRSGDNSYSTQMTSEVFARSPEREAFLTRRAAAAEPSLVESPVGHRRTETASRGQTGHGSMVSWTGVRASRQGSSAIRFSKLHRSNLSSRIEDSQLIRSPTPPSRVPYPVAERPLREEDQSRGRALFSTPIERPAERIGQGSERRPYSENRKQSTPPARREDTRSPDGERSSRGESEKRNAWLAAIAETRLRSLLLSRQRLLQEEAVLRERIELVEEHTFQTKMRDLNMLRAVSYMKQGAPDPAPSTDDEEAQRVLRRVRREQCELSAELNRLGRELQQLAQH